MALGKLTRVFVPGGVDFVKRSVHGDVLEFALASCGHSVDDVLCPRRSTLRIAARMRHTSVGTSVSGCQGAPSLGRGRGSRMRTRAQSIGNVKLAPCESNVSMATFERSRQLSTWCWTLAGLRERRRRKDRRMPCSGMRHQCIPAACSLAHLHTKTSFGSGLNARQRCSVFELVMGSTGKIAGPAARASGHSTSDSNINIRNSNMQVTRSIIVAVRQRTAGAACEAVRNTLLLVPNTMHTSVFLLEL